MANVTTQRAMEVCFVCNGTGYTSEDISPTDDYAITFSTGCRACKGVGMIPLPATASPSETP